MRDNRWYTRIPLGRRDEWEACQTCPQELFWFWTLEVRKGLKEAEAAAALNEDVEAGRRTSRHPTLGCRGGRGLVGTGRRDARRQSAESCPRPCLVLKPEVRVRKAGILTQRSQHIADLEVSMLA
jgi:hypothetical protein